jgi:hypothetical protein
LLSPRTKTALITLGVLGIGVAALGAVYLPRAVGSSNPPTAAGPAGTSSSTCGSPVTYGNMTLSSDPCTAYGFASAVMRNATLDSPPVQAFIKEAYEYHLVYFSTSKTNPGTMFAVLNVTGTQEVTGNWTGEYQVSYVGDRLLNLTVVRVSPSVYDVTHVSSYLLPDRNSSIAFTPQQVRAITVALSDPAVKTLMTGPPYYVELVATPSPEAMNDSYLVQLYQVDGTKVVAAFVSHDLSSVVGTFVEQRISGECWPGGLVITDPWDAAGYSGCSQ